MCYTTSPEFVLHTFCFRMIAAICANFSHEDPPRPCRLAWLSRAGGRVGRIMACTLRPPACERRVDSKTTTIQYKASCCLGSRVQFQSYQNSPRLRRCISTSCAPGNSSDTPPVHTLSSSMSFVENLARG